MRKFLSFSVLVFFSLIYFLSSNDYLMKKIAPVRYEMQSVWGSDKYLYGDLYGLSYLSNYKIKPEKKPQQISNCPGPDNINLFMICDSYLWSFIKTDSIFCNVNRLKYARWTYNEQINEPMDTTKRNILILEASERQVRKLMSDTTEMFTSVNIYKNNPELIMQPVKETLWNRIQRYLFNESINQNLEFNLFDYSLFTPFKELKADINYYIFDRTTNYVTVSGDKKYLFYAPTTNVAKNTSSFNFIDEAEVNVIVYCLNRAYIHFKNMGFDEIYLSIIPNPVTILDTGSGVYNELIKRIQNNKDIEIPLINVFPLFKASDKEIYYRSDSHWNYNGFQIWVDETNRILKQQSLMQMTSESN